MIPTDRTGFRNRKNKNIMTSTKEILASVSSQVRASESRTQEMINALQKELARRRATKGIISEAIPVLKENLDKFGLEIKGVTVMTMPKVKEGDNRVYARFLAELRYSKNCKATQERGMRVLYELQAALSNCEEISFAPYNFEEHGYNFYISLSK